MLLLCLFSSLPTPFTPLSIIIILPLLKSDRTEETREKERDVQHWARDRHGWLQRKPQYHFHYANQHIVW